MKCSEKDIKKINVLNNAKKNHENIKNIPLIDQHDKYGFWEENLEVLYETLKTNRRFNLQTQSLERQNFIKKGFIF